MCILAICFFGGGIMIVNKKEQNLPPSVNGNVGKFTYFISRQGSKKKKTVIPKKEMGKYH